MEIPNADSHRQYDKAGCLQKLSGRGFPYLNQWKRRYCVLTKGCLYLYEKETSKGTEKNSGVVDLKYFDHVAEALQKETKKASNVFVVTSQDRSFFDPGRHLFAADTLTEMHDWINKLRESIELIRNNNRPSGKGAKGQDAKDRSKDSDNNQKHQSEWPLSRPKSSPLDDAVDARIFQVDDRAKEELVLNLQKKLRKESEELRLDQQDSENIRNGGDLNGEAHSSSVTGRKLIATKITLQSPALGIEAKPQLESITKNRIRGPAGRRAPQSRRTVLMKQRASSLSALQHEGQPEDTAREENYEHSSCNDLLEEELLKMDAGSLNSSQPILAYHYSSDEDSPEEVDRMGSDRFLGKPSSCQYPSCSQKDTSKAYTIDEVPPHPVKGLRVYLNNKEENRTPSVGRLLSSFPVTENDELLEYRSLPRSLAKSTNTRTLAIKNSFKALHSKSTGARGSAGRLSSGRASPDMDALDNLLMNRSLHTGIPISQEACTSDHEGSETSTYKATQEDHKKSCDRIQNEELSKALERFSSTLQHLQHHTAELECRTKQIESEFNISKNDVIHLQEATEGIRKDVKKLSDTVSIVAQEASKAKREYVSQRQETERLQRDATEALSQARQSQKDFETSKVNYEATIKDLHSLISSIRSSLVVTNPEELKQSKRVSLAETGKSYSENDKSNIVPEAKELPDQRKLSTEGKKGSTKEFPGSTKEFPTQKGGYQSFFQRPTSLIYGLTSKSLNKPFNNKKEKDDKETTSNKGQEKDDKKKQSKAGGSTDKKQKEKYSQNSLEKKNKTSKKDDHRDTYNDETKSQATQSKNKGVSSDSSPIKHDIENEVKKFTPSFSIENFPMMDDFSDSSDKKSGSFTGVSHVSINVSPATQNFHLEKSLSSPTVTTKFSNNKPSRPNVLNISPITKDSYKSHSNTSSPDSPVSPSPFPYSSSNNYGTSRDVRGDTMFPMPTPNISPSVVRQSSLSSEDRLVARQRQSVFAIARQRSSPNIPIQRQSSGTIYPLQRQHSLGTVPEEGQLPRQVSLMSVPEDRPIVDQTLPLSPASSMASFALSLSPSGDRLDTLRDRSSARNSMELVTGPVISGSVIQESYTRELPPSSEFNFNDYPISTSSLKKSTNKKKKSAEALIV